MNMNFPKPILKTTNKSNKIKQKQKTKRAEIVQKLRNVDDVDSNYADEIVKLDNCSANHENVCKKEGGHRCIEGCVNVNTKQSKPNEDKHSVEKIVKRKIMNLKPQLICKNDKIQKPLFKIPTKIKYDDKHLYQCSQVFSEIHYSFFQFK
jgi:hypothetical protein